MSFRIEKNVVLNNLWIVHGALVSRETETMQKPQLTKEKRWYIVYLELPQIHTKEIH